MAAPYVINETVPADSGFLRLFPVAERFFRNTVKEWLSQIADPTTGYMKMPMDTTANLAALSPQPPVGGFRYDTTVHSLQVKTGASTWTNVGFPAGTLAIFLQETAPLGWTKVTDTEISGAIIELVTGSTGGDYGGTTALDSMTLVHGHLPSATLSGSTTTTGGHTHSGNTDVAGSHNHTVFQDVDTTSATNITGSNVAARERSSAGDEKNYEMTSVGGAATVGLTSTDSGHAHSVVLTTDGAHNHNVNVALGGSSTPYLTGVKRVKAIVCVKN